MSIQDSLLRQQIEKVSHSRRGKRLLGKNTPRNMAEFRRTVPYRYATYLPYWKNGTKAPWWKNPKPGLTTSGGRAPYSAGSR